MSAWKSPSLLRIGNSTETLAPEFCDCRGMNDQKSHQHTGSGGTGPALGRLAGGGGGHSASRLLATAASSCRGPLRSSSRGSGMQ